MLMIIHCEFTFPGGVHFNHSFCNFRAHMVRPIRYALMIRSSGLFGAWIVELAVELTVVWVVGGGAVVGATTGAAIGVVAVVRRSDLSKWMSELGKMLNARVCPR